MDNKIVKVIFKEGWETMYNNDLTQSDYGRALQIEGITLPDGNVEVHFSLTEYDGEAPVFIGTVKDKVITVNIPDFILAKENVYESTYEAYAWIYVTDGESGQTIRKIVFTIESRPKSTTDVPEAQQDQFLQEVRQVMAETKKIAQSVRDDADNGKFSGIPGEKGDDGKSAYQYAVEGGYKGTEEEFTELIAQAGQVDLTGYVTKEQHEAELLKTMVKVTTDKAPFHHITDSANMKVIDFGMEGKTEQKTTSGKNLWNNEIMNDRANALVNTPWTDYYAYPVYIGAGNSFVVSFAGAIEAGLNFHAAICLNTSGITNWLYTNADGQSQTPYKYTGVAVSDYIWISITKEKEDLFAQYIGNTLQIELGTVVTDYEPFTNGPTPNPDYPQEIVNAGVTKNLFDVEKAKDESNYIWGSKYPYFPVYVGAGNTITFSCNLPNGIDYPRTVTIFDAVDGNDLSYIWHNTIPDLQKEEGTITSPNDYIYIRHGCAQTEVLLWLDYFTDIQIELGSVATKYEPFGYKIECEVVNENHADISSLINGIYLDPSTGQEMSDKNQTSSDFVLLQTNDIYILFSGDVTYKKICFYDSDKNFISGIGAGSGRLRRQIPSGTRFIRYSFTTVSDINSANICIETTNNGQYNGTYTPHQSTKFTLTSDRPLTKWDNLVKRDGVWGWSIWQLPYVFDGSESGWMVYGQNDGLNGFCVYNISVNDTGLCNQGIFNATFKLNKNNKAAYFLHNPFFDNTLGDYGLANWKSHLAENPLEIWTYSDTEQAFYPLPDDEQILLNNLETYYGVTNMYNDQGCPMWLTYVADPKLYVDQKLLEIQQAII